MIKKISGSIFRGQIISFSILLLINFLFAFKYFSRGIGHGLLISIIYSLGLAFSFLVIKRVNIKWLDSRWLYYSIVFLYCFANIVLFHFVKVESLNVDRWSVISSFWENAFNGQYPYNARSHMGNYPGPLPFYFLVTLPFHLIGEIGYLSIIGILAFSFFIRKNMSPRESIGVLVILCLSVPVLWETVVRSTILVNSIGFMLYLFWLQKIDFTNKKHFWVSAILGGLLLSTRTIFILPLIIQTVFLFKSKTITLKPLAGWLLILSGIFILTFLPFLFFHFNEFLLRNPFSIQSDSLLPIRISALFLILAIVSGFICSAKNRILILTTGLFVLIFIVYFFLVAYKMGFEDVYWNSKVDLSYMLFAFPFLLYYSFKNSLSF